MHLRTSGPRVPRLPGLAVAGLCLAVYARVLGHDFVSYDDLVYVVENPNLRLGLGPAGLWRACLPYEHNWLPLTFLSLLVDFSLYGLHAPGFLATNVLLHTASAWLLYAALARMTRATGASAFVAAVFALHPLHVESVAWVSERKDALAGFFWMLGLWCYARAQPLPSARARAAVALCLVMGLLSKPLLVSFPFALVLLDYWPLRKLTQASGRLAPGRLLGSLREKLPLFAIAALFAGITWWIQRATGAVNSFSALPLGARLANALDSYAAYLADALWPSGLAVFYPHPLGALPALEVAAAALLLAGVSLVAFAWRRSNPALLAGWLWFGGTLVPMIGIVQVGMHARADRYMYVPLIGIAVALAFTLEPLARRGPLARRALGAAAAAAALALALASVEQLASWRDSVALYERALRVTRGNFLAHYGLAGALAGAAPLGFVQEHLERALSFRPGWAPAQEKLLALRAARTALARGERALAAGALPAAQEQFEIVLASGFSPPELWTAMARLAAARGDAAAARAHLERALRQAEAAGQAEIAAALRRQLASGEGAPQ